MLAVMARLDAIGLVVTDMAESIRFYTLLGLNVPDEGPDAQHVDIDLGGSMRLMLDSAKLMHEISDWSPPTGGHRVSLAMRCDDPASVDAMHTAIVKAGFRSIADPFDAFWGQRYATVSDPDDNPVDLYAVL